MSMLNRASNARFDLAGQEWELTAVSECGRRVSNFELQRERARK